MSTLYFCLFLSGLFTPANRSGYIPQSEITKNKRSLTNTRVRRNNRHVRNNEADDIIITDSEADDIIVTDTATGTLYVKQFGDTEYKRQTQHCDEQHQERRMWV